MRSISFDDLIAQFDHAKATSDQQQPGGADRFSVEARRRKGCIYLLHPDAEEAQILVNTLLLNLGFAGFEAKLVQSDGNLHILQLSLEDIRQIAYLQGKRSSGNAQVDMVAGIMEASPLMQAAATGEVSQRYSTPADQTLSREFYYTVSLNGGGVWEFESGCMGDAESMLQRELQARNIQNARASAMERRMIVLDRETPAGRHAAETLTRWKRLLTGEERMDAFVADYLAKLQTASLGKYELLFEDDGRIETSRNIPQFESMLKRAAFQAGIDPDTGIFQAEEGIAATLNWQVTGVNYTPVFAPLFADAARKNTLILETSVQVDRQGIDFLGRTLATASAQLGRKDSGFADCVAGLQYAHFTGGRMKNGMHYVAFHDPRGALFSAQDMPKVEAILNKVLSDQQLQIEGMTYSLRLTDLQEADRLHHQGHFSYYYNAPYYETLVPGKGLGLGAAHPSLPPPPPFR